LDPVAAVRQCFNAFNALDFDAVSELLDEDWRGIPGPGWIFPGTGYFGHEGYRSMLRHLGLPGAEFDLEVEVRPVHGYVLALGSVRVSSRDGDVKTHPLVSCHAVVDGRLRWSRGFGDEAAALAAVCTPDEEEFRLAFDAAPDAMVLLDDRARIVRANRAASELFGHPESELQGLKLLRLIPAELRQRALERWRLYRHDGRASGVGTILAAEGPRGPLEFRLVFDFIPGRHLISAHRRDARLDFDGWNVGLLTPRQREVLGLLASGLSGPETAARLFVSPATVRTHVQNARAALGARSSTQAVAEALIRGEIDWPSPGTGNSPNPPIDG
jgi:DNA-binding CsgD family transcriptional regulator